MKLFSLKFFLLICSFRGLVRRKSVRTCLARITGWLTVMKETGRDTSTNYGQKLKKVVLHWSGLAGMVMNIVSLQRKS